jgi:hypothetical protein
MRLSLALFVALVLSSCHVIVHDMPVRHEYVQVVHRHHHVVSHCHVHEEYSGRGRVTRLPRRNIGPGPRPVGPPPPRAPKAKRY